MVLADGFHLDLLLSALGRLQEEYKFILLEPVNGLQKVLSVVGELRAEPLQLLQSLRLLRLLDRVHLAHVAHANSRCCDCCGFSLLQSVREHLQHELGVLPHEVDDVHPLVLIHDVLMRQLSLLRLRRRLALDDCVLLPQDLTLVTVLLELVFFLQVANDLSVVDLLAAFVLNLLLSNLLDLQHDLVESVLVDEAVSELVSLVEQEIDIDVS